MKITFDVENVKYIYIILVLQLDAEFRRFSVNKAKTQKFEDLYIRVEKLHRLMNDPFVITYSDKDGDLLPINNDDNYNLALQTAKHILRIMVQRKGLLYDTYIVHVHVFWNFTGEYEATVYFFTSIYHLNI